MIRVVQQPHLALRERDRDIVRFERIPQGQLYIATNIGQPGGGVTDPEPQDVINRAVSKTHNMTDRPLWRPQNAIYAGCRFDGEPAHLMRIAPVRRAEIDIEADIFVRVRPVNHLTGNQIFVRDEIFAAIAGDHADITRA